MNYLEAKRRFNYDKETGKLTYRISTSYKTPVGKEAGSLWQVGHKRHRKVKVSGKNYMVHRIIWLLTYKRFPIDQIDHINGNGIDNRRENLRICQSKDNTRNQRVHKGKRFKGVGAKAETP